jgi:hypothetical protein
MFPLAESTDLHTLGTLRPAPSTSQMDCSPRKQPCLPKWPPKRPCLQGAGQGQGARQPEPHTVHIRLLLTLWAACVLKSVRALVAAAPASAFSDAAADACDAGNHGARRDSAATSVRLRAQVRSSLLCGGHVEPHAFSLRTFFDLLAGAATPAQLYSLPASLLPAHLVVPDVPPVTQRSWQALLVASMTSAVFARMAYASQGDVALLDAASCVDAGTDAGATRPLSPQPQSLLSHIALQELVGAVVDSTGMAAVHAFVASDSPSTPSQEPVGVLLPFLAAVQDSGALSFPSCYAAFRCALDLLADASSPTWWAALIFILAPTLPELSPFAAPH